MRAALTHLVGSRKGERVAFGDGRITIGRAADNMLSFGDGQRRVSAHHAELIRRGEQYLLRDLGSTNGTMINGRRIIVSELNHDDLVEFGAGGPLLRFAVEYDRSDRFQPPAQTAGADSSIHTRTTGVVAPRVARSNNGLLVGAILFAMVMGAFGGVFLSRQWPRGSEATFAEIAAENGPGVVFIRAEFELLDSAGQVTSTDARTGSGFLATGDGLIVTNRHVVRDWEYNRAEQGLSGRITRIAVVLPGHEAEQGIDARVFNLSANKDTDVAVLKIDVPAQAMPGMQNRRLVEISQGQEVAVMGYPMGLDLLERTRDSMVEPSISRGLISRIGQDYIQVNLRAYRGNSGGPVLTRRGEVIGILTATLGDGDIALCTPISAALPLIK